MTVDVSKFLESLSLRHARLYAANVSDLLVAMRTGNRVAMADARSRLDEVIRETMGVAEIIAATQVLQAAHRVMRAHGPAQFCAMHFAEDPSQTLLPNVTFLEALADMVERTPTVLKDAAERTAANIARLYGETSGGVSRIAFVKSAEEAVTNKVQAMIASAIETGETELEIGPRIVSEVDKIREISGPWSESYARMAFRTNVNTAVTAGRFRQVQDPDVKKVIPAFGYQTAGPPISQGGDTRPNHHAADGLIFDVDHKAWLTIATPMGYG